MQRRAWVDADWKLSELGRRAKVYRLTAAGRRQLAAQTEAWARFSVAVWKILLPA
jgi:DNA-binding PadR family transcriptional regulator